MEAAALSYRASSAGTASNGYVDKTAYISNASFEQGNSKGWNAVGAAIRKTTTSLANFLGGVDGVYAMHIPLGKHIEQTISGIENGVYQLVVSVGADYGNHISLYAGSDVVEVEATDFGPMYLTDAVVDDVQVTDGTLTIGVQSVESWVNADNFRLYQKEGPSTSIKEIDVNDNGQTVNAKWPNAQWLYDLSGRRVVGQPARHGVYIQGGKKIIR